jgi:hypothetical protein
MPLNEEGLIDRVSIRHSASPDAVRTILRALRSGGGTTAQFSHPDFGGMSQWSPGMSMVGEMFNTSLKSKLDSVCKELAAYLAQTASTDQGRRRDAPGVTIVQRGRVQTGGRLISEHPAQLAHKMTFSMQFSPARRDW